MRGTRGKQTEKYATHIATKQFYRYYANKHFREVKEGNGRGKLHKDSKYYIQASLYSKVLDAFNAGVRKLILENDLDFAMPASIGTLCIRKKKLTPYIDKEGTFKNPLPVDWQSTYELWEADPKSHMAKTLVRFKNKHSGGYIAEWALIKTRATFTNKSAYSFKASRTGKQLLGAIMLNFEDNNIDYQLK